MMIENAINQAIDNVLDHNMPATKPTRIMTRELILDALDGAGFKIVPASGVKAIELTPHEIQSGLDRVRYAELLIKQLPKNHEGRNTWLLNYGRNTPTLKSASDIVGKPNPRDYPGQDVFRNDDEL